MLEPLTKNCFLEKKPKVSLKVMYVETHGKSDKLGANFRKLTFSNMNKNARVTKKNCFPLEKTHVV